MQQILVILVLNIMILTSCIVQAENYTTILKAKCGTRSGDIIATGSETTVGKWPWVASIYYIDPTNNILPQHYGTASIITVKHLLTLANVVPSKNANSSKLDPTHFFAVVGGKFEGQGILHQIQYINYLQEIDSITSGIALVQLMNAMIFSNKISPICLPPMDDIQNHPKNQSTIAVSWVSSSNNISETPVLYEENVQILAEDYCQQFISGSYPTDKLMCGKCSSKATCKLGNGSPLMAANKDGKFFIVGMTNKDIGRRLGENPETPTYFIKVESYLKRSWLSEIIH